MPEQPQPLSTPEHLYAFPDETFSGVHRGPLQPGEWVTLSDPKGRRHSVLLERGKVFHTTKGAIGHDDLIDGPEGVVVTLGRGSRATWRCGR